MKIESTAKPSDMMKVYALIEARGENTESLIKDKYFTVTKDCQNDYHKDQLPIIPAGTVIQADFGGDFGIYALADVDGILHRVKICLHEVHHIDFGVIPDGIIEYNEAQKAKRLAEYNANERGRSSFDLED